MEKRNVKELLTEIEEVATIDLDVSMSCFYVLFGSDGKPFIGISIRFAEIIASCWRNIEVGTRVVSNNGKQAIIEGSVIDLEKNSTFKVQVFRRVSAYNGLPLTGEQITQEINAASSIAFRNVIFKTVPSAIFSTAIKNIKKFIVDNLDGSSIVMETVKFFTDKGVSEVEICNRLKIKSLDLMDSDSTFLLIGLKNGIESKDTTIKQVFEKITSIEQNENTPALDSGELKEAISQVVKEHKPDDAPKIVTLKDGIGQFDEPLEKPTEEEVLEKEDVVEEKEEKHPRPRGRTPKGEVWCEDTGKFIPKT